MYTTPLVPTVDAEVTSTATFVQVDVDALADKPAGTVAIVPILAGAAVNDALSIIKLTELEAKTAVVVEGL